MTTAPSAPAAPKPILGAILALVGGVLIVVAGFSSWWRATMDLGGGFTSVSLEQAGIKEWSGVVAAIGGVLLAALGVVALASQRRPAVQPGLAFGGVAAGGVALMAAAVSMASPSTVLGNVSGLELSPGIGVFLTMGGSAAAILGSLLMLRQR